MNKKLLFLVCSLAAIVFIVGGLAAAAAVVGEHVACTPTHTIADNGTTLEVVGGDCVTATDQTVPGPTTTETTTIHDTTTQTVTVTTTVGTTTAPSPPPPPPNNCTATLAAGGNVVSFVNGLTPGAVGCLHGGAPYGPGPDVVNGWSHFTTSGTASARITIKSYPGESATIRSYVEVGSSYLTFTNLKFDGANSSGNGGGGCTPSRAVGIDVVGNNNLFDHVEQFSSLAGYQETSFLLDGSNNEIRYSKSHNFGCWNSHDHGFYVKGNGNQIHHNWVYDNGSYGWCVSLYPGPSNTHVYSNVCDSTGSGFSDYTSGSNNTLENNVVSNTNGMTNDSLGSLVAGSPPSGTNEVIRNNDQWNNRGGFGHCSNPYPGEVCSGNISVDPQFVNRTGHDYTALNPSLAGYGLWNGS